MPLTTELWTFGIPDIKDVPFLGVAQRQSELWSRTAEMHIIQQILFSPGLFINTYRIVQGLSDAET